MAEVEIVSDGEFPVGSEEEEEGEIQEIPEDTLSEIRCPLPPLNGCPA